MYGGVYRRRFDYRVERLSVACMFPGSESEPEDEPAPSTKGGFLPPRRRTRNPPGTPTRDERSSSRRPAYEARDSQRRELEAAVEAAYQALVGETLPSQEREELREVVAPFSRSRARVRLPRPQTIDFAALAAEAEAARALLELFERRRQDDTLAIILLLAAY